MISGKTKSGFEFSVDETKLNNMEFLDVLSETEENVLAFSKVVTMMFDPQQKKALYDHVRLEDGTVPIEAIVEEVTEVMSANADLKNS